MSNEELALKALDKGDAEQTLLDFMRLFWHITDPAQPFIIGWPIEAICEHLEAVSRGDIRTLLINVPPGFSKSTAVDVFWPAWEWGPANMPFMRYVCAAYSAGLTVRDNRRFLRVIQSDLYRELWGDRFALTHTGEIKVENTKTGWKFATSVTGVGTGERGNRVIADDPNSIMEAESEVIRAKANTWFREVVPDRLNDKREDAIVIIQQRTHENDVSGNAMDADLGYTHLMIPMEFDTRRRCVTVLGFDEEANEQITWEDPRTEDGELAWPERFPEEIIDKLKLEKGPYAYAGQYQQEPSPRGGGIIQRNWWKVWPPEDWAAPEDGLLRFPDLDYILASVDTAMSTKQEADESACTVWGAFRDERDMPKIILLRAWSGRYAFNVLVDKIIDTCRKRKIDTLLIEAKANGLSVAQEIQRLCGAEEWGTRVVRPTQDKVARTYAVQHLFAAGLIYAPDRNWADKVITQCEVFPKGRRDDLVDTTTQALKYLRDIGLAVLREEREEDLARRLAPSAGRPSLPYDV